MFQDPEFKPNGFIDYEERKKCKIIVSESIGTILIRSFSDIELCT